MPKKLPSPKLFFIHGFLGDPQDWDEVIAHLPGYTCEAIRYPFQLPTEGILIGYSMGGRIALTSPLPKILISSHPGLETEEEKSARWMHDQQWIEKLKKQPIAVFLRQWYAQPLFDSLRAHPSFPRIMQRRTRQDPKILLHQLKMHSLAFQSFKVPSKTVLLYGSLDSKYKALYERYQLKSQEIIGAGHACHLEKPLEVAEIIKNQIDLR